MVQEDPRVTRTRRLLVDAFRVLLNEKGFDRVSVQDISDRAAVNRATFYSHFRDKYALFEHVAGETFRTILDQALPGTPKLTSETLATLVQTVAEYRADRMFHCSLSVQTQFGRQLVEQVCGQLEGFLVPQLAGDRSRAVAAAWAIYGLAHTWSQGARLETAAAFASRVQPLVRALVDVPDARTTGAD